MAKRWYVVHAYSGMEKSVGRALQERVDRSGMQDMFGKILVPTEEVVEMKNGQRTISERRFFPGYVLVEMEMNDDTWHLVKNTNKVTGFVGGSGNKPAPISQKEVDKIMSQMAEGVEKPKPKTLFEVGEMVRVHRLQRQRRGRELREEPPERVGHYFRQGDAGRTRVRPGREVVTAGCAGSRNCMNEEPQ